MENTQENCHCQEGSGLARFKNPRFVLIMTGMILLAAIVIFSIIREKFVPNFQNQVTVSGRGKVEYKPDMATVTLGVQVDKAPTAEAALSQLNDKMNQIIEAEKALGIGEEKIKTQNYSLSPQYDFKDGVSSVSGYTANQQIAIEVSGIGENTEILGRAISEANRSGANQVLGIKFETADVDKLKEQARVLAIQDAKAKSKVMAKAAGVRLGKILSWYENVLFSPDAQSYPGGYGMGGESIDTRAAAPAPQVPSGTQEIVIEMNVSYEVK